MLEQIKTGDIVFLAEGSDGIGTVRELENDNFILYVENAGEFEISFSAITRVHDGKVLIDPTKIPARVLEAVAHAHDREDPNVAG